MSPRRENHAVTSVAGAPDSSARLARVAVAALFMANGALMATVVPRYPDIRDRLDLTNAALGAAISGFWVGALVVGLSAGWAVNRFGSARVAWGSTALAGANLALVALAPSWGALVAVLLIAGSLDAVADVAENAQGLLIERRYGRSVLNSLHAMWSIGAVVGGVASSIAAGADVPLLLHFGVAGALVIATALVAARFMLPDQPLIRRTPPVERKRPSLRSPRARLLLMVLTVGLIATLAQAIEDTGSNWSALYLRDELGAGAALAGMGFVALQGFQTIGRLVGDRVVFRYGDVAVARAGATLAGVSMGFALLIATPAVTILGFGLVGLGIATLIPSAMRAAGRVPGMNPGTALTLVGSVSRVGSILAAPLIGIVADASSIRLALVFVPIAAALLVVLAPALRTAAPQE